MSAGERNFNIHNRKMWYIIYNNHQLWWYKNMISKSYDAAISIYLILEYFYSQFGYQQLR